MKQNSHATDASIELADEPSWHRSYRSVARSCLFRGLSVFLAFCILTFLIIRLPMSDTNKLLIMLGLLAASLLALWLTTPRRAEPTFPDESVETENPDTTETVDEPDDTSTASLSTDYFEQLVREALNDIPAEFEPYMANLAIFVEDEPDAELRKSMHLTDSHSLLGIYQGNPLTSIGHQLSLPEHITIFQKPIEAYCQGKPNRIRRQVRATVLHEIAHHFGIDHDEMPRWLK